MQNRRLEIILDGAKYRALQLRARAEHRTPEAEAAYLLEVALASEIPQSESDRAGIPGR